MFSISILMAIISTLFVLFVFAALVRYGIKILNKYKKLKEEGIAVPGVIIGHHLEGKGEKDYYQIVRFRTKDNEEITAVNRFEGSSAGKGQQVTVYYSPENPNHFVVGSRGIQFTAYVTILLGISFLLTIIIWMFSHNRLISFF